MGDTTSDNFSYAEPDDPRLKRFVIRLIERMSGQPYLKWLYDDHLTNPLPGESFWDAAVRTSRAQDRLQRGGARTWPQQGPLIVVSNHPFGVLDGVVASAISCRGCARISVC